jgi:hypothetical protein
MSLAKPTPPLHTFEATSSDLAKNVSRQPPESEHSLPGKQAGNQLVTSDHRPNKGVILSEDESYCSDETVENEPTDPEWNGSSDGEDDTSDDDNQSQRMIQYVSIRGMQAIASLSNIDACTGRTCNQSADLLVGSSPQRNSDSREDKRREIINTRASSMPRSHAPGMSAK